MKNLKNFAGLFCIGLATLYSYGQDIIQNGSVHGNFQADVQYYNKDAEINAPEISEKTLMNGFANIIYTNQNFTAGVRYESYLNALQGYDPRYKGNGIPYRFATYAAKDYELTVGNYYEQFGNGMILRAYEDKNLGIDNALDGLRIKVSPYKGTYIKGIYGVQRFFFDKGVGIIRGADAEINIFELLDKTDFPGMISIGGSMVSRYQKDEDPVLKLPENVAAFAGRLNASYKKFGFNGEYAMKMNDPSSSNNMIYREGKGLYLNGTFSQKGFGVAITAKYIDNMDFRSDRTATGNVLMVNYLPALSKQHQYTLPAMLPYATQTNGEAGIMAEITYTLKKGTLLGGTYGTQVSANYSRVQDIYKTLKAEDTHLGYDSKFLEISDHVFFEDANVYISKKLSKKIKSTIGYANITYDKATIEGHPGDAVVYAQCFLGDVTYKFNDKHAIRTELQYLLSGQHEKDWSLLLFEYSLAPKLFIYASDQFNHGNPHKQLHYYNGGVVYIKNAHRVSLNYGRQREGIVCVGGVCRAVPAFNGASLTITSSF